MTYSPFDALDPYSDEYATNDNSIGNTNTIKKSFDRKDPFAHLDAGPLVAKPQAVTKPDSRRNGRLDGRTCAFRRSRH